MAILFTAPVAIKTFALSFICNKYDAGQNEKIWLMASDLSVECAPGYYFSVSDGGHGTIKVIGLTALLVVN